MLAGNYTYMIQFGILGFVSIRKLFAYTAKYSVMVLIFFYVSFAAGHYVSFDLVGNGVYCALYLFAVLWRF